MIKICGTTSVQDAQLAARAGAQCLGIVVNYAPSPRGVSLETARQIAASTSLGVVAVTVNQSLQELLTIAETLQVRALQLHGDEAPALVAELTARGWEVWKAIAGERAHLRAQARRFTEAGASALVVDARAQSAQGTIYGGTGQTANWDDARALVDAGFRVILAGGLAPANVAEAIEKVRPWGVDVVSGVEARGGVKDPDEVRAFVEQARRALERDCR